MYPTEGDGSHQLYFMTNDLRAEIVALANKSVRCSDIEEARWGLVAHISLPAAAPLAYINPRMTWPFGLARTKPSGRASSRRSARAARGRLAGVVSSRISSHPTMLV